MLEVLENIGYQWNFGIINIGFIEVYFDPRYAKYLI